MQHNHAAASTCDSRSQFGCISHYLVHKEEIMISSIEEDSHVHIVISAIKLATATIAVMRLVVAVWERRRFFQVIVGLDFTSTFLS